MIFVALFAGVCMGGICYCASRAAGESGWFGLIIFVVIMLGGVISAALRN